MYHLSWLRRGFLLSAVVILLLTAVGLSEGLPIDLDLKRLSSTMCYAMVNDLINAPERYEGQRIRLHGYFQRYHAEGKDSCRLLAVDTTSCCLDDGSVSIEFTAEEELLATLVPGQAFELIGIIRMQPHGAQNIAVIAAESIVPLDGMVSDIQW